VTFARETAAMNDPFRAALSELGKESFQALYGPSDSDDSRSDRGVAFRVRDFAGGSRAGARRAADELGYGQWARPGR
jgi:hypothetical protein